MKAKVLDIEAIQKYQRAFVAKRDWQKFHTPKNLAMALNVEAAELLEIFQWLTEKESFDILSTNKKTAVEDELADISVYLLRLCDVLNIDLPAAIKRKQTQNAKKYPAKKVKGSAKKYTEY